MKALSLLLYNATITNVNEDNILQELSIVSSEVGAPALQDRTTIACNLSEASVQILINSVNFVKEHLAEFLDKEAPDEVFDAHDYMVITNSLDIITEKLNYATIAPKGIITLGNSDEETLYGLNK